jgi:hypothetical protein
MLLLLFCVPEIQAGEPCCHVLICCRSTNDGIKFQVKGEWNPAHNYGDINQARDILQKIKDAGISTVIIDMTNASQWTNYWNEFEPMVNNIQQVCEEKKMHYFLFIGASLPEDMKKETGINRDAFSFWNDKAKLILNTWAKNPAYRKYGFGDDRPMLLAFQPSEMYWKDFIKAPENEKNYLSKFHIGTTQVNDPILPGASDGWGYRNYSQSVDGNVRFVSPNTGLSPTEWKRISGEEWLERVKWASEAGQYSIYGSYDDVCDAIHWGIADTKNCNKAFKKYPNDDPYFYYKVVKEVLTGKK